VVFDLLEHVDFEFEAEGFVFIVVHGHVQGWEDGCIVVPLDVEVVSVEDFVFYLNGGMVGR
jgi:hypothetical protein